jgi:hypothetical protein
MDVVKTLQGILANGKDSAKMWVERERNKKRGDCGIDQHFVCLHLNIRNAIACLGTLFRYKAKSCLSSLPDTLSTLAKLATTAKEVRNSGWTEKQHFRTRSHLCTYSDGRSDDRIGSVSRHSRGLSKVC